MFLTALNSFSILQNRIAQIEDLERDFQELNDNEAEMRAAYDESIDTRLLEELDVTEKEMRKLDNSFDVKIKKLKESIQEQTISYQHDYVSVLKDLEAVLLPEAVDEKGLNAILFPKAQDDSVLYASLDVLKDSLFFHQIARLQAQLKDISMKYPTPQAVVTQTTPPSDVNIPISDVHFEPPLKDNLTQESFPALMDEYPSPPITRSNSEATNRVISSVPVAQLLPDISSEPPSPPLSSVSNSPETQRRETPPSPNLMDDILSAEVTQELVQPLMPNELGLPPLPEKEVVDPVSPPSTVPADVSSSENTSVVQDSVNSPLTTVSKNVVDSIISQAVTELAKKAKASPEKEVVAPVSPATVPSDVSSSENTSVEQDSVNSLLTTVSKNLVDTAMSEAVSELAAQAQKAEALESLKQDFVSGKFFYNLQISLLGSEEMVHELVSGFKEQIPSYNEAVYTHQSSCVQEAIELLEEEIASIDECFEEIPLEDIQKKAQEGLSLRDHKQCLETHMFSLVQLKHKMDNLQSTFIDFDASVKTLIETEFDVSDTEKHNAQLQEVKEALAAKIDELRIAMQEQAKKHSYFYLVEEEDNPDYPQILLSDTGLGYDVHCNAICVMDAPSPEKDVLQLFLNECVKGRIHSVQRYLNSLDSSSEYMEMTFEEENQYVEAAAPDYYSFQAARLDKENRLFAKRNKADDAVDSGDENEDPQKSGPLSSDSLTNIIRSKMPLNNVSDAPPPLPPRPGASLPPRDATPLPSPQTQPNTNESSGEDDDMMRDLQDAGEETTLISTTRTVQSSSSEEDTLHASSAPQPPAPFNVVVNSVPDVINRAASVSSEQKNNTDKASSVVDEKKAVDSPVKMTQEAATRMDAEAFIAEVDKQIAPGGASALEEVSSKERMPVRGTVEWPIQGKSNILTVLGQMDSVLSKSNSELKSILLRDSDTDQNAVNRREIGFKEAETIKSRENSSILSGWKNRLSKASKLVKNSLGIQATPSRETSIYIVNSFLRSVAIDASSVPNATPQGYSFEIHGDQAYLVRNRDAGPITKSEIDQLRAYISSEDIPFHDISKDQFKQTHKAKDAQDVSNALTDAAEDAIDTSEVYRKSTAQLPLDHSFVRALKPKNSKGKGLLRAESTAQKKMLLDQMIGSLDEVKAKVGHQRTDVVKIGLIAIESSKSPTDGARGRAPKKPVVLLDLKTNQENRLKHFALRLAKRIAGTKAQHVSKDNAAVFLNQSLGLSSVVVEGPKFHEALAKLNDLNIKHPSKSTFIDFTERRVGDASGDLKSVLLVKGLKENQQVTLEQLKEIRKFLDLLPEDKSSSDMLAQMQAYEREAEQLSKAAKKGKSFTVEKNNPSSSPMALSLGNAGESDRTPLIPLSTDDGSSVSDIYGNVSSTLPDDPRIVVYADVEHPVSAAGKMQPPRPPQIAPVIYSQIKHPPKEDVEGLYDYVDVGGHESRIPSTGSSTVADNDSTNDREPLLPPRSNDREPLLPPSSDEPLVDEAVNKPGSNEESTLIDDDNKILISNEALPSEDSDSSDDGMMNDLD